MDQRTYKNWIAVLPLAPDQFLFAQWLENLSKWRYMFDKVGVIVWKGAYQHHLESIKWLAEQNDLPIEFYEGPLSHGDALAKGVDLFGGLPDDSIIFCSEDDLIVKDPAVLSKDMQMVQSGEVAAVGNNGSGASAGLDGLMRDRFGYPATLLPCGSVIRKEYVTKWREFMPACNFPNGTYIKPLQVAVTEDNCCDSFAALGWHILDEVGDIHWRADNKLHACPDRLDEDVDGHEGYLHIGSLSGTSIGCLLSDTVQVPMCSKDEMAKRMAAFRVAWENHKGLFSKTYSDHYINRITAVESVLSLDKNLIGRFSDKIREAICAS